MRTTRPELVKMQQAIADGRPPTPASDGEFYWHPKMRLALRLYHSGRGIWLVKYRNERGFEKTWKIGSAAVLNTTAAEDAARKVLGKVYHGADPQSERQELRVRPKLTLRAMCELYFEEMASSPRLSPRTLYNYRSFARNHLGALANMQLDEVTRRDVSTRISEIAKEASPHVARHFRSMLSSVCQSALVHGRIDDNPVVGTWQPEAVASSKPDALTLAELGAIWRACETLAAVQPRYKGNVWGAAKPNTIVASDDALLTLSQAARQSGLDTSIFHRAVYAGEIKVIWRRDAPDNPDQIRQGFHRRTYLITGAELRRFAASRSTQMRSPQADYAAIVRLLILLGCRYSEIAGLRWNELDLDKGVLRIPTVAADGQRRIKSKRGKPKDLTLYLPQLAVDILRSIERKPGDFLFGNGRTTLTMGAHTSGMTQNARYKEELDRVIAANEGKPIRSWKLHWLRHSFTTHLNEMEIDPRIIEAITNHLGKEQVSAMASRYTHTKYPDQQRRVLEAWAQRVRNAADRIETEADNVVRGSFGK